MPDTDGDGYSDVTPTEGVLGWNVSDGADAFPLEQSHGLTKMVMAMETIQVALKQMIVPEEGYSNVGLFGVQMLITMVQHNLMMHSQMTLLSG